MKTRILKSSCRLLVKDLPINGSIILYSSDHNNKIKITKLENKNISIVFFENNKEQPLYNNIGKLPILYKSINFKKNWFIDITDKEKNKFICNYNKFIDSKSDLQAIKILNNCYNLYNNFYSIYINIIEKLIEEKGYEKYSYSESLKTEYINGNFAPIFLKLFEPLNIKITQSKEDELSFILNLTDELTLNVQFIGGYAPTKYSTNKEYYFKYKYYFNNITPEDFKRELFTKQNAKKLITESKIIYIMMDFKYNKTNKRNNNKFLYLNYWNMFIPIYENYKGIININHRIIEVLNKVYNININHSDILTKTLKSDGVIYNSEKDIDWTKLPYDVNYLWKNIKNGNIISGPTPLIEGNTYDGFKYNSSYGHVSHDLRREYNFDIRNWPNNLTIKRPDKFWLDSNKIKEEEYIKEHGKVCYRCNSTKCKPNIYNGVFDMYLCKSCSVDYFYEVAYGIDNF